MSTNPLSQAQPVSTPSSAVTRPLIFGIPGPKILLLGGPGSGKTHSLRTLLDAGIEHISIVFTEPGQEVLGDVPADKLSYHYIRPATASWATMISQSKKINTLSFKALAELSDMDKRQYTQMIDLYECLSNFKDDRTGKHYGPVDEWPNSHALVIDSLSGMNAMAMKLVTGGKPVRSQADWQVAMDQIEQTITKLTTDVFCPVVITAHLERETDEITGGTTNMVSTLGRKLAPKIPRFFSECIHVKRDGNRFTWSTVTMNTDLKTRFLPFADNLAPSFTQLFKGWEAKGGKYEANSFAPNLTETAHVDS